MSKENINLNLTKSQEENLLQYVKEIGNEFNLNLNNLDKIKFATKPGYVYPLWIAYTDKFGIDYILDKTSTIYNSIILDLFSGDVTKLGDAIGKKILPIKIEDSIITTSITSIISLILSLNLSRVFHDNDTELASIVYSVGTLVNLIRDTLEN